MGRISHRTGCLGTAQGMFPAQVNKTTSRKATTLRSELNGQAAWAATSWEQPPAKKSPDNTT